MNHNTPHHTARHAALGLASLVGLALLTSACGSVEAEAPATSVAATTSEPATTAPATTPSTTAVTDETSPPGGLDAVAAATVQIVAQGTFVDPEFGAYEGAGAGSGFVIGPNGIAVTNNHVVAGAGLIQVYVPGRPSRATPRCSACRSAPTWP
jgi:serine protease Do